MVVRDQCGGGVDEAIELEAEVLEREREFCGLKIRL